ncbi:MAG TPA: hypothetical protein VFD90_15740 [Gaiellales bacterium]|jgi:hypothetical protein|nr:hypothetical protein [Gaiellales bacterium]
MNEIPTYATHYHVRNREPFLNLSDLSDGELFQVMEQLDVERLQGDSKRIFGSRYIDLRKKTETKLRALFVAAGGKPQRAAPHYFVLGTSNWFKNLSPQMQEVRIALSELPSAQTTFTYPDSFTAMAIGPEYGLPYESKPYHERVFRLEELSEVVRLYGTPRDEVTSQYHNYHKQIFEKYVEIQLWSDEPLRDFQEHG